MYQFEPHTAAFFSPLNALLRVDQQNREFAQYQKEQEEQQQQRIDAHNQRVHQQAWNEYINQRDYDTLSALRDAQEKRADRQMALNEARDQRQEKLLDAQLKAYNRRDSGAGTAQVDPLAELNALFMLRKSLSGGGQPAAATPPPETPAAAPVLPPLPTRGSKSPPRFHAGIPDLPVY